MADDRTVARRLELGLERVIMASRWLQAPLYAGSIKIKLASSIVAISSIHLLQRFLESADYDNSKLYAMVVMHMAFVVSALLLTYIDRLAVAKKVDAGH